MDYEEIVDLLAPCGLDCSRCIFYGEGAIKRSSVELAGALDGFEKYAPAVARTMAPAMADYDKFAAILELFAGAECSGCRETAPPLPFCSARTCFKEKDVDFCFQCDEYPCARNSFPESLDRRWRLYNDRMKEVGVEAFYEEVSQKPRWE